MHPRKPLALFSLGVLLAVGASGVQEATAQVPMPVSFESVQVLPRRAPDREHAYGSAPSQRVYGWLAQDGGAGSAPVVVLLHGGCWFSTYGVDHVEPLATALASEGFAVWAPEYRRVGEPGAGWPGTFEDVASALDLLKDENDPALDPERVVLVGHSAGGHLALWAATRGAFEPSHPLYREAPLVPRGVVGLAAISDLAAFAEQGGCQQAVPRLMGGTPASQSERYRLASPAALPHPVPVVLIHGAADGIVPVSQTRAIPGARARLIEGADHFDLIHPGTAAFDVLVEEIQRLLGDRG